MGMSIVNLRTSPLGIPRVYACLVTIVAMAAGLVPLRSEESAPVEHLAHRIADQVAAHYYDQSRVKPRLMVEHALRVLRNAETGIQTQWIGNVIIVRINDATTALPVSAPTDLDGAMTIIDALRTILDHSTLPAKRSHELTYAMVNAALSCLDPHTELLPPDLAKKFLGDLLGQHFFGIGAYIAQKDGMFVIARVSPGRPAEQAGVEDGDLIIAIDGESTVGMSLEDLHPRIRGMEGTHVVLSLERHGHPLFVTVPRGRLQADEVHTYRAGDVGYISMTEFTQTTADDLRQALHDLGTGTPLKAVVLDLRSNVGGLVDQAKLVAAFFLARREEIVRMIVANGVSMPSLNRSQPICDLPLAVLISGATASAAEIVSGALRANERAVLIGNTTFGKGSGQELWTLSDGGRLKFTSFEWRVPGGLSIQDIGLTPDIQLIRHQQRDDGSVAMRPFPIERESDEEFPLPNHQPYQLHSASQLSWLARYRTREEERDLHATEHGFMPNDEAMLVLGLLSAAASTPDFTHAAAAAFSAGASRQFLLERLREPLAQRAAIESVALAALLASGTPRTPGIVWGPATPAAQSDLSLRYVGPQEITAGEDVHLDFAVTNFGLATLGRLYVVVRADVASPLWWRDQVVGAIAPHSTVTNFLDFKVPPRLQAGEEHLDLDLFQEGRDERLASVPIQLQVTSQPDPHLHATWALASPTQDGGGMLTPGGSAVLLVTLRNDGAGTSFPIDLHVYAEHDHRIQLSGNRQMLAALAKDAAVSVRIPISMHADQDDVQSHPASRVIPPPGPASAPPITGGGTPPEVITLILHAEEDVGKSLDGRLHANLRGKLLMPLGVAIPNHALSTPVLSHLQIEHITATTVRIRVSVSDVTLRAIMLFNNDDKIDLQPAHMLVDGVYQKDTTLVPGVNVLRVLAVDQDDSMESLSVRLWGGHQPTDDTVSPPGPGALAPTKP